MVEPNDIADYLLSASRERGEILTNLKLQKLLYYAQAWYLALRDRALFDEDFEAWVHGPVLPSQYHRFKGYSWRPIVDELQPACLPDDVKKHLDEILDVFGSESAVNLEAMTHFEAPWREARGGIAPDQASSARISKDTMKRFYRSMQG
jgi:uncharacterized phage-associated protein